MWSLDTSHRDYATRKKINRQKDVLEETTKKEEGGKKKNANTRVLNTQTFLLRSGSLFSGQREFFYPILDLFTLSETHRSEKRTRTC